MIQYFFVSITLKFIFLISTAFILFNGFNAWLTVLRDIESLLAIAACVNVFVFFSKILYSISKQTHSWVEISKIEDEMAEKLAQV